MKIKFIEHKWLEKGKGIIMLHPDDMKIWRENLKKNPGIKLNKEK